MECFRISFEIIFSTPEAFSGFLEDLSRSLEEGSFHRIVKTLSTFIYGDDDTLVKIAFSEESGFRSAQTVIGLGEIMLKASGSIICLKPSKCAEIYEIVSENAKNRRIRIRLIPG
ncbi:MAG: hypothetical protein QW366_02390 [Sulfolobales archaeon]